MLKILLRDLIYKDGKPYLRVSKISGGDYSKINPWILERKKQIGTDVHRCIESDIRGEFDIPELEGSSPYYSSYLLWRDELQPKFIQSEKRYFCDKYNVTGQIDALVLYPGSQLPILVDFKTSYKEQKQQWIDQAHMYYYLITEAGEEVDKEYHFVKLDKDGNAPKVFTYRFNEETMTKCLEKATWSMEWLEKTEDLLT